MKIEKYRQLPIDSLLNQNIESFDFVETYLIIKGKQDVSLDDIITSFFDSFPKWFQWMMNLNAKSKTMDGSKSDYSESDIIGPFHLFRKTDREAILGVNAKHLDYRVSLVSENIKISISIVISINTLTGKCYFVVAKIIHYFFIHRILKNMSSNLWLIKPIMF